MQPTERLVALVTGGSRGIGAATAAALAARGYDVVITYRNKAARASKVAAEIIQRGTQAIAVRGDITQQQDIDQLFAAIQAWRGRLDLLVLNASGGLERDLLAADPNYPMRINRDAQLALLEGALPLMPRSSVVVFVTSHWAHRYGQIEQLPNYAPIAETKYAGEQALRAQQERLAQRGIRLIVVTGDLIEGTITPKLLERKAPGLADQRRGQIGALPTASDMGEAIAAAATDPTLPSGHTVIVGGTLESTPD
ncbi:MAG TPA: SDR family oxidoreductase [Ktedonobacterales bacterium]|jgi:NAD(P)-dependent dehydrogenase (short-subunit alcohol dehydrogenase family)